ncbi:hypothetical protein PPYR_14649 [Photinus pyralis]|uniref:Major facilitator superfamily (MFS) profile domain-containing protein n=2 Tax=Photinus pyralis TaxID=7054 RepID=A0A5N4A5T6_PHOPY|nr:facilitated trehalose transporter Tret1-like [Photinus pyralis]KAB0792690.1 hypothetical protein PPYR_14649 [Photinus pyralis]
MQVKRFTIEKRLLQYSAAITGLLVPLCNGLHFGWTSPYLPVLLGEDSPIPMTADESSWVGNMFLLGGLSGCLLLSIVGRLIGRKSIVLWSSVPFFASWLLIAFATSLPQLLIGRYIGGIGAGVAIPTLPIYISEISDKEIRGMLCSAVSVVFFLGIMLINVIGAYVTIKMASLVCLPVPILLFVLFFWMPESPNYLLMKGKHDEARQNFVALKGSEDANHKLDVVAKAIQEESLNKTNFISILKRNNHRKLLTLVGLRATQQFSGVTAFNFYALTVFAEGSTFSSPLFGVLIFYAVEIVFSVLSSLLVDKLGRKPLLISSSIGAICALLGGGSFFYLRDVTKVDTSNVSFLPTFILITFTFSYSLGLQAIPSFMAAELFSTNLKPYAGTLGQTLFYVFGIMSTKYFQFTKDYYGFFVPFWSFAVCCTIGLVVLVIFMPETKNKTLEDIQIELNR